MVTDLLLGTHCRTDKLALHYLMVRLYRLKTTYNAECFWYIFTNFHKYVYVTTRKYTTVIPTVDTAYIFYILFGSRNPRVDSPSWHIYARSFSRFIRLAVTEAQRLIPLLALDVATVERSLSTTLHCLLLQHFGSAVCAGIPVCVLADPWYC